MRMVPSPGGVTSATNGQAAHQAVEASAQLSTLTMFMTAATAGLTPPGWTNLDPLTSKSRKLSRRATRGEGSKHLRKSSSSSPLADDF